MSFKGVFHSAASFGIVEFAAIDPMYQFSLQWFQQLFQLSVDQTPKSLRQLPSGGN